MNLASHERLAESEWRERQQCHIDTLRPFAEERLQRSEQGKKHPINDFLFEYYSLRPTQLLRWSPGVGVILEGASETDLEWGRLFRKTDHGMVLLPDDLPENRRAFVQWVVAYLEAIRDRPPSFNCLGLHEWAMVYRESQIRHARTPLRLSPDEIAAFVESQELRCTHYDAFRFFTPLAVPRNRHPLKRETTPDFDQSGCVHVNMDLYKWCYKISPFIAGELLRDSFLLAWDARQLDMRASPYDLREFSLEPIPLELPSGREQYVVLQRELHQRSIPVRERVLAGYRALREFEDEKVKCE